MDDTTIQLYMLYTTVAIATFTALAAGIASLAAIASAFSAYQARKATQETRKAAQSQLVTFLLGHYDSRETYDALKELRIFFNKYPQSYAHEFVVRVEELDYLRRRVSHYFQAICTFYKLKYINKDIVRVVASEDQVEMYLMLEPIEQEVNKGYDSSTFRILAGIHRIEDKRKEILAKQRLTSSTGEL